VAIALVLASGVAGAQPAAADAQAQFDAAFDAMTRGDLATASTGFHAVAGATADPELRGAANQLARLADDLMRRNMRLVAAAAPPGESGGAPMRDTVGVSEDDQSDGGRTSFIVSTTIASLYSGVVLLDVLDVDDVRTGTLVVMGSTTVGLLGSLYGTRGRTMTGGMADAWSLGLMVGTGNALLLSGPLGLYEADENASEKVQTFVLGAAWGGAAASLFAADRIRPTRAQVSVTGTFVVRSASTRLSVSVTVWKLGILTFTAYRPMGTTANRNLPDESVTAIRENPRSTLVSVTVAPGSTPPVASFTSPASWPT